MNYVVVETPFFKKQFQSLYKKFLKISTDWEDFIDNFDIRFGIDLGHGIYKFRIRNSSIPTGKSGGFRVICKVYNKKILPLIIFSKTEKENTSKQEILLAMEQVFSEL